MWVELVGLLQERGGAVLAWVKGKGIIENKGVGKGKIDCYMVNG